MAQPQDSHTVGEMIKTPSATHTATRMVVGLVACLAVLEAALWSGQVHAARPLLTDDARVVDEGHCQVESWTVGQTTAREFWALPACSGGPGVEWALGGQRTRTALPSNGSSLGIAQYKRMLVDLRPGGVGVALAVGTVLAEQRAQPYFYLPVSWMSAGEGSLIHLNIGGSSKPTRTLSDPTWGLGLEQRVTDAVWLIAERYSPSRTQWQAQAGVRWWLMPGRLQLDATTGQQHDGPQKARFTSVGLRWIFPRPI